MKPLYNNKITGVSYTKSSNRWRAYINETHIGTFDTYVEAATARLEIEEIFKTIISKLEVDQLIFHRDGHKISIEVITDFGQILFIKTNILYQNSRKKSTTGGDS